MEKQMFNLNLKIISPHIAKRTTHMYYTHSNNTYAWIQMGDLFSLILSLA